MEAPRAHIKREGKHFGAFQTIQYATLIVLELLIISVSIIPAVMGWMPLTILSGPMAPSMPAGNFAAATPIDIDERENIPIGTVIAYMSHPDLDELVTCRATICDTASNGDVSCILKDGASDGPDFVPVLPKQTRAEKKYSAPFAGRILRLFTPDVKFIEKILLTSMLLMYTLWQVRMNFRECS